METPSSQQYKLLVSGTAPPLNPTVTFFGLLWYEQDGALQIPERLPFQGEWGQPISTHLLEREEYPIPGMLDLVWLSIVERKFYSLVEKLPMEKMEALFEQKDEESNEVVFEHIVVGMAPYGGVAAWTHGFKKSALVSWMQAEEIQVDMKDFMPMNPTVTLNEICDFYINSDSSIKENLEKNGLPPRNLFDNFMKQFMYRYKVMFGHWDDSKKEWKNYFDEEIFPDLDYIEEVLYDGTHDKLHDGGLMKYHEAGKPKKLAIQWHIMKSEYSAYFWFEDEPIRTVYDRFYGAHPETKTDFIIRIDPEKKIYELALYRHSLKEPQVISDSAYQLIVFKNKFENYRSKNYDQPRGAWVW